MEKKNYSNDKFNNRYNENYSPLVSSRNKNKSYEIKEYNEYNPNSVRQTTKYSSYFNNHLSKDRCRNIIYIKKQKIHLKLKQDNLQYSEFSDIVEEKLSGEYFKEGCFSSFSGIAMKSAFGNSEPTDEELQFLSAFSKELAGNIYRKSNIFVRIYLLTY